jgi:hypothetical protein
MGPSEIKLPLSEILYQITRNYKAQNMTCSDGACHSFENLQWEYDTVQNHFRYFYRQSSAPNTKFFKSVSRILYWQFNKYNKIMFFYYLVDFQFVFKQPRPILNLD